MKAYDDSLTKWVENAEPAKFSAFYFMGGRTHDALDFKIVDIEKVESMRRVIPLAVVGNGVTTQVTLTSPTF